MNNSAIINITTINNNSIMLTDVLSFKVVKEYYTPYTTLSVEVVYPVDESIMFKKVQLILNGFTVHSGLVDTVTYTKLSNYRVLNIKSKSFTAMLCQNQLEDGIKSSVSLNSLMDSFITIPEVTHEDNSTVINYIYVKPTSSLWEAVVNLTHKLNGSHPYVCDNNKVMVSKKSNPKSFSLTSNELISSGRGLDTTRIISNIHMKDIDGNYNTYNINNLSAGDFGIVRHKQIDLDRQYLSNPQDALTHRIHFSMRGYSFAFGSYNGYRGEDIGDLVSFYDYFPNSKISKIEVTGNNANVITKLYAYNDNYVSYES